MLRKKKESIEWLEFEHLQHEGDISHGIFLRSGGVSTAPFASLNAGGKAGDTKENIAENCKRIRAILGINDLFSGEQVHGDKVAVAPSSDALICDGLITQKPGLGLMINHADCQAALLYDPVKKIVANIHAGWRGQVQNIYGKAVEQLATMGCKPQDLLVGICPSLGPCCAEFQHYKQELPESFWEYQVRPFYFDLWQIAKEQLLCSGILPHHLQIARICTKCHADEFFSYRREKTTGRNGTVIALKSPLTRKR